MSLIKPAAGTVQDDALEPFPSLEEPPSPKNPQRTATNPHTRSREQSTTSTIQERLRSASKNFSESSPPTGMWIATGQIASSVPSLSDIRRGSYSSEGWSGEGQIREKERRATLTRRGSSQTGEENIPRRRSSANPNSPREVNSNTDIIPETVPEGTAETERNNLGVINSGVPVGSSGPTMSMSNPAEEEKRVGQPKGDLRNSDDTNVSPTGTNKVDTDFRTEPFDNGYQFPPKHKWTESTAIGLKAFWGFFLTPLGFVVVIYGLNVVAWGGMLFLLLCNASPAMCKPTCNDINSPRRIWIEIDSQILNALFCVTGFGLIPWRFRDLYYLLQYRIQKNELGLRRLAGINRGWFRLAGSQDLAVELGPAEVEAGAQVSESCIPFPISKTPNAPLTGIRAPPTKMWKLDFVIWSMVWNTFLQAVLSGFMWGLNRYDRPSWSTGLFVALACIIAAAGGIMMFVEGKHVKAIEGIPISEKDQERLKRDREAGITHYNNIKDAGPKEEKAGKEKGLFKRKQKAEAVVVNDSAMEEGAAQIGR